MSDFLSRFDDFESLNHIYDDSDFFNSSKTKDSTIVDSKVNNNKRTQDLSLFENTTFLDLDVMDASQISVHGQNQLNISSDNTYVDKFQPRKKFSLNNPRDRELFSEQQLHHDQLQLPAPNRSSNLYSYDSKTTQTQIGVSEANVGSVLDNILNDASLQGDSQQPSPLHINSLLNDSKSDINTLRPSESPFQPQKDREFSRSPSVSSKRRKSAGPTLDKARLAAEEDKRRRNTAASARFRIKKKLKEQEIERTIVALTKKTEDYQHRLAELEMENKLLKSLVVEKNNQKNDDIVNILKDRAKSE